MTRWIDAVVDSWLFALAVSALKALSWLALGLFCLFLFVLVVIGGINLLIAIGKAIGILP